MSESPTAVLTPGASRQSASGAASAGQGPNGARFRLPGAAALWAISLFLLLNFGLSAATSASQRLHKAEEKGATYQACDSAIEQFKQTNPPAQTVMIGSSVVMAPLWSVDARRFQGVSDVYHHHRSLELSQLLSGKGLTGQNVFAFALPGLMISDGYLLADKLLDGASKPGTIVYGLAPRDFMDDLLTGETRTVVFQRLMQLEDLPRLGNLYLSSPQEKGDFVLNNVVYLYGKRWRYQDKIAAILKKALVRLAPPSSTAGAADNSQSEQQFLLGQDRKQVWQKSVDEYRARYKHFDESQFTKQERFLERLLALANQRQVKVVLVNMPLTADNLSLMPSGFYSRYLSTISNLAGRYGTSFLDLQKDKTFTDESFYDTVHLNDQGGEKFLDRLSSSIASTASASSQ